MGLRSPIQLIIVDSHHLVREAAMISLGTYSDIKVIGTAASSEQLLELCQTLKPDVVLMEDELPYMNGINTTKRLRQDYPAIQVILYTQWPSRANPEAAAEAGASQYLLENSLEGIYRAIRLAFDTPKG